MQMFPSQTYIVTGRPGVYAGAQKLRIDER
jgi:hypothetical protein